MAPPGRLRLASGTHGGVTLRDGHASFQIVAAPPNGLDRRRFVHVIGTSVFTDDRVEDESWATHFVGVLDGHALYAVDVPDGDDPSDGAHVDLRRLFGRGRRGHVARHRTGGADRRVGADASVLRAVRGPDRLDPERQRWNARPAASGVPAPVAGDDHARHSRRRGPDQEALLARGVRLAGADVLVPRRVRRARRDARASASYARSTRRSGHGRTTSATRAASRGRSRTA